MLSRGYGDAFVGTAKGVAFVARHPLQTLQGIGTAVIHPIQTGQAIINDITEKSGTLRGQGSLVGDVLIGVATGGAVKAVSKTATVAKITSKLRKIAGRTGTVAEAVSTESQLAETIAVPGLEEVAPNSGRAVESFRREAEAIVAKRQQPGPRILNLNPTPANPVTTMFNRTLAHVQKRMPKSWKKLPAAAEPGPMQKASGWRWIDENGVERYRYMHPDKNGRFPHEKTGYWRVQNELGEFLDEFGNVVPKTDPLFNVKTHIMGAQQIVYSQSVRLLRRLQSARESCIGLRI